MLLQRDRKRNRGIKTANTFYRCIQHYKTIFTDPGRYFSPDSSGEAIFMKYKHPARFVYSTHHSLFIPGKQGTQVEDIGTDIKFATGFERPVNRHAICYNRYVFTL